MATTIDRIDPSLTGAYRNDPLLFSPRTARVSEPKTPEPAAAPNLAVTGLKPADRLLSPPLAAGGGALAAPAASAPDFRADLALLDESIQALRGSAILAPKSGRTAVPAELPGTAPVGRTISRPAERISDAINQINALKTLEKAALERAAREEGGIGGGPRERVLIDARV